MTNKANAELAELLYEEMLKRGARRLREMGPACLGWADVARQNAGCQVNYTYDDVEVACAAFCVLYKMFDDKGLLDTVRTAVATNSKNLQLELTNGSCVLIKIEGNGDA
jgi:hypothetical protein